jgi:hypothetical protein
MFHLSPAARLAALSAIVASNAMAQATPSHHPPAQAEPPALPYRSAFEGYQRFRPDDKPVPWKDANTTVDQRGGWRAYAKEAAGDEAGASGHGSADPHAGHKMPMPPPQKKEQP